MFLKKKVIIIILIFLSLELLFYFSFKFSNSIIFENRLETKIREYERKGLLKDTTEPMINVAVFGGSSANGYGSTINFTEILNNMSILSNANIKFDNHSTPATPFYLFQAEKIKRLVNDYDVIVIYAGHNEWLHFNHKKKFFPNNTKTTDYNLLKKYWKNLLKDELNTFYSNNHSFTNGENLIFNNFTNKIRLYNFTYRAFSRIKESILEFYYKNFFKPKKENIKEIRYFYQEKFFNNSDHKIRWEKNFKQSILEIEKILPKEKRLILINPLSNLLIPPIADYDKYYDKNNEKKISIIYKKLENKKHLNSQDFNEIKNGAHKSYLIGLFCLEKLLDDIRADCIKYLSKSKDLDSMPWTIISPIQNFITNEAPKISEKIKVIDLSDFEKLLLTDQKKYQSFFLDYVHPSKYGHSYLANQLSEIFFSEKIVSKLVFNSETPKCPDIEYYIEKKLIKKISTFKRYCNQQFTLINNWHNIFKSFTKSDSHFINDKYFDKNNF
ncbi:hypothetical protein OA516_01215 [Candidatus Pelagibacter sp.]|nr:hypothetical protein [Candidatus Pelagibacter sp.]